MGRKHNDPQSSNSSSFIILFMVFISCTLVYAFISMVLRPNGNFSVSQSDSSDLIGTGGNSGVEGDLGDEGGGCCRGIENLELWGPAVKWGTNFKFSSSEECCRACKSMCTGTNSPCLCDTWVFCGNREACGSKFGECWLKKQKDSLAPDRQDVMETVWTSGLIYGQGEGIVGMETKYGTLHIKLLPDCAPRSVAYILELLVLRHCAGCQFYRAETRGELWDSEGNHIKEAPLGPPFALIQGTLEAMGTTFKKIPREACPTIRRGSVAWIGSGPEFFISLANHVEWKNAYTVFGSVLAEDMEIVERIAQLPTRPDYWNNINVSVLEDSVSLLFKRIKTSHGDLSLKGKTG